MKRIFLALLVTVSATIFFAQTALSQPHPRKGSSPQDLMIKYEVETAISMLQTIFVKHQKGEWTLDQAKQLGADLLRGLQYGKDGYFWADTTEGVNVVLYGQTDVEGKSRLEFKDAKGKFIVKDFIAKGKAGGGYEDYWFPKEHETTPARKRSYVQAFEPFGWVIGTGYYLPTEKASGEKAK